MKTGEKIRILRAMKGFSQENMADMVGLSRQAYGDIERGNTNPGPERIAQIADKLGLSPADIEAFGNAISNFFDQCNQNGFVVGSNETQNNNYDARELQHQNEKLQLEIKLLQAEKEKAEMEARYWREKSGEQ